jgi:hypothetical protein
MASGYREDFERRLLALVRSHLDWVDEEFPHGYEIVDFVITWEDFYAPTPDTPLEPWEGGPYPGWLSSGATLGSSTSFRTDERLLEDALEHIRRRMQGDEDDEVESEEPAGSDE